MTIDAKTGYTVKSPSFTPHTEKSLQSERNEDSAPQHLEADVAAQGGVGEAAETLIEAVRVPLPGGLFALVEAADAERVLAHRWRDGTSSCRGQVFRVGSSPPESLRRFILGCVDFDFAATNFADGAQLGPHRWQRAGLRRQQDATRPCVALRDRHALDEVSRG